MREINLTFGTIGARVIPLGVKGENLELQVRVDCAAVLAQYTGCHPALQITAPDGTVYAGEIWMQGTDALWQVKSRDTAQAGRGSVLMNIVNASGTVVTSAS
ncbi:MAG: hypothetical protein IJ157_06640, partial [Clostridia bacterium]|nr:hypothetical protein [Clostridia bacterium]